MQIILKLIYFLVTNYGLMSDREHSQRKSLCESETQKPEQVDVDFLFHYTGKPKINQTRDE